MKLSEAAYCVECEELFPFNRTGCPACGNKYTSMLALFFTRRQAQEKKELLCKSAIS